MEYRITIDDETLVVHTLSKLMGFVDKYDDDRILQHCYDDLDGFAEWLRSVDDNKAKTLVECRKQIRQHGVPFMRFVLKAQRGWSSVRIVKEWGKTHSPIMDEPSEESPREWVVTEDDVKAAFNINDSCFYVGTFNLDPKKRNNAILAMGIEEDCSQIFAQYDTTVWGGAREGFVITTKGIYVKLFGGPPIHWRWNEIEYVWVEDLRWEYIEINGYQVFVSRYVNQEIGEGIRALVRVAQINAGVDRDSLETLRKARLTPWYKRYEELLLDSELKENFSDVYRTISLLEEKATSRQDPIAQYALAYISLSNYGSNAGDALDWLRKAAAQGMVMAIRMLCSLRAHPEYLDDRDAIKRIHASFG